MPYLRKATPGNDSFGNTWDDEETIVEVPHEQAADLLAIPDGGFTLVDSPAEQVPDPEPVVEPAPGPEAEPVTEPAPEPAAPVDEAPKPPTRGGRRKAADS